MAGSYPDGITEGHERESSLRAGMMGWIALVLLSALMLAALLGVFGGARNPTWRASSGEAALVIDAPAILRNGEFFEMRIRVEARRPIAKPVLAVSSSYWRDLTINTTLPSAAEEKYEDGAMLFAFDPLTAGQVLRFKVDGQINPPLFAGTSGTVSLRDGDRAVASVPLSLTVLP